MVDYIKHIAILRNYIVHIENNRIDSEEVQVWLLGVINCLENAVYSNRITNTALIGEISTFISQYHSSLDRVSDVDNDFDGIYNDAVKIIDKVLINEKL